MEVQMSFSVFLITITILLLKSNSQFITLHEKLIYNTKSNPRHCVLPTMQDMNKYSTVILKGASVDSKV